VKIADVRCFTLAGRIVAPQTEARQVGMLNVYPEFAARPVPQRKVDADGASPISGAYVEIETDDGLVGVFGPIF
jgi:hypothetical protein